MSSQWWQSSGRARGRRRCAGRFRPTQATGASRREAQDRGDRVGVAGHDGRGLTMATASGGASWRQSRAEGENGDDCYYLKSGRGCPASTAHGRTRHGTCCVSRREETAKSDQRRHPRGAGGKQRGGARPNFNFDIFTELPLRQFCKLLTNFLKKLKISKNESCSIFQTLQLCF